MNIYTVTRKDIEAMDGVSFEELVMSIYEELGYECTQTPASNDYGTDIIVSTPVGKFSIQCKRQTSNVGIKAVQEVYGSLPKYGAVKGIVITTSGYTANAIELAKVCNVELIDGNNLWAMITGMQNGEFVKNSKENIREELEKISEMAKHGNEVIKSFEERATRVVDMASNEIEYLKNISKVADTKMSMISAKVEECLNIEMPQSIKGDKGDKGENGKDGVSPENCAIQLNITTAVSLFNFIIIAYLALFHFGG